MENFITELVKALIPEGSVQEYDIDGEKVTVSKKDGVVKITSFKEEKFDDSYIKELIKDYKDSIKDLDDCVFVEAVDDFSSKVDLKRFNELLDKESFTETESNEVEEMIDASVDCIQAHLEDKINKLVEVYKRF